MMREGSRARLRRRSADSNVARRAGHAVASRLSWLCGTDARRRRHRGPQQMQLAPCARAGHVKQALPLLIKTDLPLFAHPFIQRLRIFAMQADRRDQKFVFRASRD